MNNFEELIPNCFKENPRYIKNIALRKDLFNMQYSHVLKIWIWDDLETSSSIAKRIWHRYSDSIDGIIMSIPRRAATRSLELSARGRRPGAQQVPHYVHVHTHTHIYIIAPSSFSTYTHTAYLPSRSLAQSHDHRSGASPPPLRQGHPSLSVTRFLCFSLRDREKEGNEQRREKRGTRFE